MIDFRVPCETCRVNLFGRCEVRGDFLPLYVLSMFAEYRPGCNDYEPLVFRGLEGCVP